MLRRGAYFSFTTTAWVITTGDRSNLSKSIQEKSLQKWSLVRPVLRASIGCPFCLGVDSADANMLSCFQRVTRSKDTPRNSWFGMLRFGLLTSFQLFKLTQLVTLGAIICRYECQVGVTWDGEGASPRIGLFGGGLQKFVGSKTFTLVFLYTKIEIEQLYQPTRGSEEASRHFAQSKCG